MRKAGASVCAVPGPYVQLATFCEKVLQEKDGVLSVIRLVDRILVTASSPDAPDELPLGVVKTILAVALKADDAMGRYAVTIRIQEPSGAYVADQSAGDVTFEGAERGVNLIMNLEFPVIEGLYWFDVVLSGTVLARVPLRIMYQRAPVSA